MKKVILTTICLMVIGACGYEGPFTANQRRTEERHQTLMKLYDLRMDPNTAATELATINTYIGEIEAQQRHEQQIKVLEGIDAYNRFRTSGPNIGIDTYGYGVHSNRFGQPIKLIPDFGYVPGEELHIREDAYGFGVHSDQYGRPVREYPWP